MSLQFVWATRTSLLPLPQGLFVFAACWSLRTCHATARHQPTCWPQHTLSVLSHANFLQWHTCSKNNDPLSMSPL